MQSLGTLLNLSFSSTDNDVLTKIQTFVATMSESPELYDGLFTLLLTSSVSPSIRVAAAIQLRHMINSDDENLRLQIVLPLFTRSLSELDSFIIFHFCPLADYVVEKTLNSVDWASVIESLISGEHFSGVLVLLYSLTRFPCAELSHFMALLLELFLSDDQTRQIVLKTIRHFLKRNSLPSELIGPVLEVVSPLVDLVNERLRVLVSLFRDYAVSGSLEVDTILRNVLEAANTSPKSQILQFQLLTACALNPDTAEVFCSLFPSLLGSVYFPRFAVTEEVDGISFICEHHFDSFSARDDPRAACFRSLQVVSEHHPVLLPAIAEFAESLDDVYGGFHLLLSVFPQLVDSNSEIAEQCLQRVHSNLSSSSVLGQCGALLSSEFDPSCFLRCVELLGSESIAEYFAAITVSKLIDNEYEFPATFIVKHLLRIALQYGVLNVVDAFPIIFQNRANVEELLPFAHEIATAAFTLIEEHSNFGDASVSIASAFNTLLSLIESISEFPEVEQSVCELVVSSGFEMISRGGLAVAPLFEVLCNAVFYSPNQIEESESAFELLRRLLKRVDSMTFETISVLFANLVLKCPQSFSSEFLVQFCSALIEDFGILQCNSLVSAVMKTCSECAEFFEVIIERLIRVWAQEELNFFEDATDMLTLIAAAHGDMLERIGDQLEVFVKEWIDSIGPRDPMAGLPAIARVLSPALVGELIERLVSLLSGFITGNSYECEEDRNERPVIRVRKIELESLEDIFIRFACFAAENSNS
jgi:hypothetical protein